MTRPTCRIEECKNLCEISKRTVDRDYYRTICTSHKRKLRGETNSERNKRKARNKRDKWCALKKDVCSQCGWKGPCDIHRIVHGSNGGQYVEGNVLEICPNCHRLEHRGLIKLQITTL